MIARTNKFKEKIKKLGKEIDFKINIYTNDKIITENNKFLMTEDNLHLVVEQFSLDDIDETITSEDIYNVSVIRKGNLLSTMMKEVDFEVIQDLRVGDVVDCSFGLKVDNDYEYINYGKFIIFSKEHNEDTNTYSYVAYDSMLFSMVEVDDTSIIQGVTVQEAIENICEKVGLNVNITAEDIENLPNLENVINEKAFTNIEMTYRDVLDQICQCLGITMISDSKNLYLKSLNDTIVDSFDAQYLKDINVKFSDKYMINSVVLSRSEDNDNIYKQDEDSVAINGVHEFKIKDNLIMLYDDREDYIDEIFEQLNGVEFYINDFSSTGITYLEPLDFYNIVIGDNTYKCLLLNDEIKVQQGLEESIYTEMPEETTTDYKTSGKTDKEVSFIVDKQNGKITGKVSQDDIIASLNLAVEDGQGIVELKGNSVIIESDNFDLDAQGNAKLRNSIIELDDENGDKLATLNNKGLQFYKDEQELVSMGTTTIRTYDPYQGQIEYNSALTRISLGQSIDWWCQRTDNPDYDDPVLGFYNSGIDSEIVMYKPVKIMGKIMGKLTFDDETNAGVITTTQSQYYNDYVSKIVTDGTVNFLFSTVFGDITVQGSLSDERLKQNINDSKINAIEKIKKIKHHSFDWKIADKHIKNGYIAQELEKIDKDLVIKNNDKNGLYQIDMLNMLSLTTKAIQEQQEQIEELKKEIKSLKGDDI